VNSNLIAKRGKGATETILLVRKTKNPIARAGRADGPLGARIHGDRLRLQRQKRSVAGRGKKRRLKIHLLLTGTWLMPGIRRTANWPQNALPGAFNNLRVMDMSAITYKCDRARREPWKKGIFFPFKKARFFTARKRSQGKKSARALDVRFRKIEDRYTVTLRRSHRARLSFRCRYFLGRVQYFRHSQNSFSREDCFPSGSAFPKRHRLAK